MIRKPSESAAIGVGLAEICNRSAHSIGPLAGKEMPAA